MKALIIGATGSTGKELVKVLLQDSAYTKVVVFVRKSTGITDHKLEEILTDFDRLEDIADHINGTVLFSCLGTTLKDAGSKEQQWHIDYEIPFKFAEIAKRKGIKSLVLVSAYGASPGSKIFYSRIKGELEEAMANLAFAQLIVFKPGMLIRKGSDRAAERIIAPVLNFLSSIGLFKRFKPLSTEVLAAKLAKAPKVLNSGIHVIELEKITGF
ncbi:NAD(P)H-binding protein [Pedobacter sp. MC2016-14]|uniref:NAD(P)H-binding protein n=1 Tax=Pedobacter sp. MC2016-14 TaxID=2897327 RepID=UPI001E2FB844|nr:NAD(P)H-binding protein [Pedobacter sp. MC2016-14]MCD0488982.1 NAD(P)H-binding protein [Pedobacter sp. MC2016-14]